jgi:hypothetical protein
MLMKRCAYFIVAAFALALSSSQVLAQNLLENPSFELPTVDQGSANDVWFRFGSGAGGTSSESTAEPRTGSRHIALSKLSANQFAGVFQNINESISPGQVIQFTGFHKAVGVFDATAEIKLEWQGSPNPPQSRMDVLAIGNVYEPFSFTATAPAGTTGLVVTYATSSFGAGQGDPTTVYIDDFSAIVVPEPATLGTLAFGVLGLARPRRHQMR